MYERERALRVLSKIPPSALNELQKAVDDLIAADIGTPTPTALCVAANIFEAKSPSMRVMDGAIAQLFAALLRVRATQLLAEQGAREPA